MRIAIDCFKQVKGIGKSVGIYNEALYTTKNLVNYRENASETEIKDAKIAVFGNNYNKEDFEIPGVEFINVEGLNPLKKVDCILWELFAVSRYCKKYRIDKILYPRGYNAIHNSAKEIVLINDLIPYFYNKYFPKAFNKYENFYIMKRLKLAAKTSDHIVTISNFSKTEIIDCFRVEDKKVSIVYCGLNEVSFVEKDVKNPYICAGTSKLPHKNVKGIVNAYIAYYKKTTNPLPIIINGIDSVDEFNVPEEIRHCITCVGFTKDNTEYYSYIANAKVFLYLSLIEGFGYPPIEAMQIGVPVVCSNRASMPETIADAGELVNPDDSSSVADALQRILSSDEYRESLIEKGKKNVKRFSWEIIAKQYWDVFISKDF